MKQIKNLLTVLLALLIVLPLAAQEERTIKRKVAIGRFSNETQYAKGIFYDKENDHYYEITFAGIGKNQHKGIIEHVELTLTQTDVVLSEESNG